MATETPEKTPPPTGQRPWLGRVFLLLALVAAAVIVFKPRPEPETRPPDPAVQAALDELADISAQIETGEAKLAALRRESEAATDVAELQGALAAHRAAAAQKIQDIGALMEVAERGPDGAGLVRFASTPVERRNYEQIYHPIEGPQSGKMPGGFGLAFGQVIPQPDGSLLHRLDEESGSAIKWEREKQRARTQGHYTVEATINRMHPGVIYAPLWLYSEGASEGHHEFDFELTQGRIEYNLHNGNGGFNMRKVEKDISGHRMRYEIIRRPGEVTMRATSLTDGWSDELVITPARVAEWAAQDGAPEGLRLPADTVAMFPVTELWRCRWPNWCGEWVDLQADETVDMLVHGYRFDP